MKNPAISRRGPGARRAAFFIVLAAAPRGASSIVLDGQSRLGVTQDFLYSDNVVTGSKRSSSFLTQGDHFVENLGLLYNRGLSTGTRWEGAFDGRWTDDPRIDAQRFDLNRLYYKGENARQSGAVGDYMASFSPYALGKSLKGARYAYKPAANADVTVIMGIDKAGWTDLWQNKATETVDRKFYGARASARFADEGFLGTSFVWSDDARAPRNTTAVLSNQRLIGVDWSLPIRRRLHLYGESAYAKTDNDNPTSAPSTRKGQAHLVHADYAYRRFKTQDTFERVSPDFATTGGAAATDLIRFQSQNQLTTRGPWKFILNYAWFHNNLNHAAGATTSVTRSPEAGLRYDGPDWRPTFSAQVKARDREVASSRDGSHGRTRSLITDWSDRFGDLALNLNYEYQHEDNPNGSVSAGHHILGVSSSYFHRFSSGWKANEGLNWNLQRDRNNMTAATDQAGMWTLNGMVMSPWGLDVRAGYSRNLIQNAVNPGADRRTADAAVGYNIRNRPEHRIELRFKRNDNRFTTPGQDFKETVWQMQLTNRL